MQSDVVTSSHKLPQKYFCYCPILSSLDNYFILGVTITMQREVLPLRMGRSIVYFCTSMTMGNIFVSITDRHHSMDELFDLSSNQRQQMTVGKLFSDRNPSPGMRSLLKAFKYMLCPCTKTLSMVVEFHSMSGIVCAVKLLTVLINSSKEHCFPQDWYIT